MAIVDLNSLPAVPWKNGGGVTRTLGVWPEGAGFDDFAARVSIADVRSSGAFSIFPGVDRTILLLDGGGMILRGSSGPPHALTTPFVPYFMRGDDPVDAVLVDGAARDFNVMVRRSAARARVEVWDRDGDLPRESAVAVFFCPRGEFEVSPGGGEAVALSAGQFVTLSGVRKGLHVSAAARESTLIGALLDFC